MNIQAASALGVHGTPTFLIGYWDPSVPSSVRAVLRVVGAHSFEDFDRVLVGLLKTQSTAVTAQSPK